MIKECSSHSNKKAKKKLLEQAARELLLSQSSDWSFILRAGTTTEIARDRINLYLDRFWTLIRIIKGQIALPKGLLKSLEEKNQIFPLINTKDWSN